MGGNALKSKKSHILEALSFLTLLLGSSRRCFLPIQTRSSWFLFSRLQASIFARYHHPLGLTSRFSRLPHFCPLVFVTKTSRSTRSWIPTYLCPGERQTFWQPNKSIWGLDNDDSESTLQMSTTAIMQLSRHCHFCKDRTRCRRSASMKGFLRLVRTRPRAVLTCRRCSRPWCFSSSNRWSGHDRRGGACRAPPATSWRRDLSGWLWGPGWVGAAEDASSMLEQTAASLLAEWSLLWEKKKQQKKNIWPWNWKVILYVCLEERGVRGTVHLCNSLRRSRSQSSWKFAVGGNEAPIDEAWHRFHITFPHWNEWNCH